MDQAGGNQLEKKQLDKLMAAQSDQSDNDKSSDIDIKEDASHEEDLRIDTKKAKE